MRKTAVLLVAVCGALVGAGCQATLDGTCDAATREVAFRVACTPEQLPQYAGQALVNKTCAGEYCHGFRARNHVDPARPDLRHGVPGGFDFDLEYAGTSAELDRLRQHQAFVFEERGRIFDAVESGFMAPAPLPPSGDFLGFDPAHEAQGTFADTGEELPALDTPEGRAILRAWLVCGVPVVERMSADAPAPGAPVGDALDGLLCPVEPTFDALFAKVIRGSCALSGCHGGTPPTGMMQLDPDDADLTYASLVGVAAMGSMCGSSGLTRVIPGDTADASLLLQKLVGNEATPAPALDDAICGDRMPQGGPYLAPSTIQAFRDWIAAGALR